MTAGLTTSGTAALPISLVIPCYNDAESLAYTVPALAQAFADARLAVDLIVVDNGSNDDSGARIDSLIAAGFPVRKVSVDVNRGKGHGLRQGFAVAQTPWIGFIDADCPVAPVAVAQAVQCALTSPQPALITVRRRHRVDGWQRTVFSVGLNTLTRVLFPGLKSSDINANPKIWPRSFLERLQPTSAGWSIDLELVLRAHRQGLPILELDALAQPRPAGKSHVVGWRASLDSFRALLRLWWAE